jgi:hypothetical protein
MPKTETGHTARFFTAVDAVIVTLLENGNYLKKVRSKELTQIISEQLECSKRTAQRYIKEARKEVNKVGKSKKEEAFIKAVRDREYLIAKTKSGNKADYKLALEIMKDRDKLYGLYVEKVEHSGTINLKNIDTGKLTDEQLAVLKKKIRDGESEESIHIYLQAINALR